MPFSLTALVLTRLNFAAPLKTFIDGLESSVGAAQTTANGAQTLAATKYGLPVGGIPDADRNLAGSVGYGAWTGTAWPTRPAGYRYVEWFSDGTGTSTSSSTSPIPPGMVNGDRLWRAV